MSIDAAPKSPTSSKKPDAMDLSVFCHQMSLVLRTGIHPIEGVPLIADEMDHPGIARALVSMGKSIARGESLSESLKDTNVFPHYLVSMSMLGEQTGMLDTVMEDLSLYYEREDRLKKRLRNAVTYPIILAVLMTGLIVLLLTSILPMFANVLTSLGTGLPAATMMLLSIGNFLANFGWIVLLVILLFLAGWMIYVKTNSGRIVSDRLKTQLPVIGKIHRKIAAAHFSNGMSMVLRSGMTMDEGLALVEGVMDNRYVAAKLSAVAKAVTDGEDITEELEKTGLFPRLFVRMLRVGQKTGEMDQMMAKVSSVFDDEVDHTLQTLTQAIEPILVIVLSLVVAVVLLAVMLPLINIMGAIG